MAQTSFDSFKDLDLTRDEIDRIGEALKDKEFRKLFADYVSEVNDPANRLLFEQELTQLERERGVDVTFINPQPGYVIKTSLNGSKKAFVNVCASDRIGQPASKPTCQDGSKGLQWSLPHSLAPPREDFDNKKVLCQVFDVVFHSDTLHLASKNPAFKNMVNKTACDAVETHFDCKLDQKNLKFPNLKFKGVARPTIIRKEIDPAKKCPEAEEGDIMNKIFEHMPKVPEQQRPKTPRTRKNSSEDKSKYATPKYEIKHRSHIELENFTYDRCAKMTAAIPKELVVEICLPMLKAATDIDLDVTEKTVQLKSETPAKYKLSITLPYKVNETSGSAKFDKDTKKLIVTLPVKRNRLVGDYAREDSGVESDHGSISPPRGELVVTPPPEEKTAFLDATIEYTLPEYTCHLCENLIFTLAVKNVQESTMEKMFNDSNTAVNLKFMSVSAGHFPSYYAFCVKLPTHFVNPEETLIETWDNNVVVQIVFTPCDRKPAAYMVGISEESLEEKLVDEKLLDGKQQVDALEPLDEDDDPEPLSAVIEEILEEPQPQVQKANKVVDTVELNPEPKTRAIDILGSHYSESSGDEMSCSSYSPKCKGILKRMSVSSRSSVSRSVSESSVDDFTWASSFENCYLVSQDSVIHEEDEPSTSLKKTVRFSNHVLRQLFRSNSSILGQKKKNQRKNRNKKRANERRHSESEVSEGEKERETKTNNFKKPTSIDNTNPDECKKEESIFPLDM